MYSLSYVIWYNLVLRNRIIGVYCLPNVHVSQPFVPVNPSYLFMGCVWYSISKLYFVLLSDSIHVFVEKLDCSIPLHKYISLVLYHSVVTVFAISFCKARNGRGGTAKQIV